MLVSSCSSSSAFNAITSAVTSIHRPRSLSVRPSLCLLLTVHCVISGSFQCDAEMCKSALLVLSISDRIILKQRAACLPVGPLLVPQLIRLTESAACLTPAAFPGLSSISHATKQTVKKPACCCQIFNKSELERNQEVLVVYLSVFVVAGLLLLLLLLLVVVVVVLLFMF